MTVEQICVVDAEYRVWQPFGLRTMRAFGDGGGVGSGAGVVDGEEEERRVVVTLLIGIEVFCVACPAAAVALLYCAVAFGDIVDVRFMYPGASGQIV